MTHIRSVPTDGDAILNLLRQQALVVVRLAERVLARREEDLVKRPGVPEATRQATRDYTRHMERISILAEAETINPTVLALHLSQLTKLTSGLIDAEAFPSQASTVFAIREMCGAMEVVSLTLAFWGDNDLSHKASESQPVEVGITSTDRLTSGLTSLVALAGKSHPRDWSEPVRVCLDWLVTHRDKMCAEEVSVIVHALTPALMMATLTRDEDLKGAANESLLALHFIREYLPPVLRNQPPPSSSTSGPQGRFAATFVSSGTHELSLKSRLADSMTHRTIP
jgi:hypothetical protein